MVELERKRDRKKKKKKKEQPGLVCVADQDRIRHVLPRHFFSLSQVPAGSITAVAA